MKARHPLRPFFLTLALCALFGTAACGVCDSDEGDEIAEGDKKDDKKKGDKKGDKKKGDKKKNDKKSARKPPKNIKKPPKNTPLADKLAKKQRTGLKTPGKKLGPLAKPTAKGVDLDFANKKGLGKSPKAMPNPLEHKSPPPGKLEDMPPTPIPSKISNQSGKQLDLTNALTRADIKNSTGYRGILRPGPLVGIEPGLNYGSLRLKPNARDKFGVALQVWREPNPGAQSRKFNDLLRQYPDSKRSREMGDSAFRANWGGLNYLVWLNRKSRFIAAVSCSSDICKDDAATLALAKRIAPKIKKQ